MSRRASAETSPRRPRNALRPAAEPRGLQRLVERQLERGEVERQFAVDGGVEARDLKVDLFAEGEEPGEHPERLAVSERQATPQK